MHRLWLANAEEALPKDDPHYEHSFATKTMRIFPRFMLCLKPGDCLVLPAEIPADFAEYIIRLLSLPPRQESIMRINPSSEPYTLPDSVLADKDTLSALKAKISSGEWKIEPFIETSGIVRVSEALDLNTGLTKPELVWHGIINMLNDKGAFKRLAAALCVPVVPGLEARSLEELKQAIHDSSLKYKEIMLRKVMYAGGSGNWHGTEKELLSGIEEWYSGGKVLAEPFLDLSSVAGTLAYLNDEEPVFIGMDRQVFKNGGWTGFDYPYPAGRGYDKVKEYTERIAAAIHMAGARGYLNLDWAFDSASPEDPIVLECNFRSNGFSYVTEFAEKYFGPEWQVMSISCREDIQTDLKDTKDIISRFSDVNIDGRPLMITGPGMKEGAVITAPPFFGGFSAAVFSHDPEFTRKGMEMLKRISSEQ